MNQWEDVGRVLCCSQGCSRTLISCRLMAASALKRHWGGTGRRSKTISSGGVTLRGLVTCAGVRPDSLLSAHTENMLHIYLCKHLLCPCLSSLPLIHTHSHFKFPQQGQYVTLSFSHNTNTTLCMRFCLTLYLFN